MIPSYHFPLCEFEVDVSTVDFLLPIEISCSYIPHLCMCYWVYINPVQGPQLGKKIMKKLSLSYFKFPNKGLNSHFLIYFFWWIKYVFIILPVLIIPRSYNLGRSAEHCLQNILEREHDSAHHSSLYSNELMLWPWNKYKDTLKNEIFNIIQSFTFAEVNTMV